MLIIAFAFQCYIKIKLLNFCCLNFKDNCIEHCTGKMNRRQKFTKQEEFNKKQQKSSLQMIMCGKTLKEFSG